ncbi:hypothetical protein SVIOM342S_06017 [Streptomyces violaceorubidus]
MNTNTHTNPLATAATPLTGRTALVTGGSRGIGAASVLRLAQEGADVALTYVNGKDAAEDVVRPPAPWDAGRWPCGPTPPTRTRRAAGRQGWRTG